MIPSPTLKVLSSMQKHQVKALLMGGQACVWYGAAEFSRDTDLAVLVDEENLLRLRAALDELVAEVIAVPPFEADYLQRGHAVHFRCQHPAAVGLRVDIMSKMRGVDAFPALWERRESLQDDAGNHYELLSLPDLVAAKKTSVKKTGRWCAVSSRPTIFNIARPRRRLRSSFGFGNCGPRSCSSDSLPIAFSPWWKWSCRRKDWRVYFSFCLLCCFRVLPFPLTTDP